MSTTPQAWNKWATLYWLVAVVHLIGIVIPFPVLQYVTKPLLMPLLAIALTQTVGLTMNNNLLLLLALLFSWAGDVLLMFVDKNELFFIAGLIGFLCAHVMYILYFLRIKGKSPSLLKKRPVLVIAVLAYGVALILLLFPSLGTLRIPVLVYACVILTMLLTGLHIFLQLPRRVAQLFAIGAAFFVLSDSVLAINKFYASFPFAGIAIMLTYCIAQFCLIKGGVVRSS